MATHLPFTTLVLALSASLAWAQPVSVSVVVDGDTFEDRLSPYGSWIVVAGYGRVWQPAIDYVGDDFHPYASDGHWVFTDEGWVFDSDYPFGWAVFHYGRWLRDADSGWVWLPGNTWAPAWVTWRRGGNYVGWAPMGPRGAPIVHRDHWLFVESRELELVNVRSRAIDQRRFRDAASVTRPVHAARPIGRPVPIREVRGASRAIPPPPARDQPVPPREVRDAPYRAPPPPQGARREQDRRVEPQRERSPSPPPPGRLEPQRAEPRGDRDPQSSPPGRVEPQRAPPRLEPRRDRDPQSSPPGRVEPQRAPQSLPPGQVEPQRAPPALEPRRERDPQSPPPGQVEPPRGPPRAAPPLQPGQPDRRKRPEPGAPPPPSRNRPR